MSTIWQSFSAQIIFRFPCMEQVIKQSNDSSSFIYSSYTEPEKP